ncbi:ROK family protein [Roseobacter sp. HKCCA0434]|uniref:ROK family protein n=1 Tax=Roseobacter sp. HKCCA0434 TaxID=3079297 RepID=UPI00290588BD|nr:ROK family protein [Roseobacter sp. HKCCA0434]
MPIGVDYGGTKIEAIAIAEDGEELSRRRVATPRHDYPGSITAITKLVSEVRELSGLHEAPVGIGIPGAVAGDGRVFNGNSTWLIGQPLAQDLSQAMGCEVSVANDANCFVLSEAIDGAGRGAGIVFGAILGTGVGGGLVVEGRMVAGASGMAGEWGHSPLPIGDLSEYPGPECFCGRRGCIEQWLSGPGLEADYARDCGLTPGTGPRVQEIVARAQGGEDQAENAIQRHRRRLARALAGVVNVIDPDVIILGGGVSNLPGLAEELPELMRPHVYSTHSVATVRRAVFGDSSGVRGAARIARASKVT